MDLSKELLQEIIMNWEDEEWTQPIDDEKITFRCQHYHEYGLLGRDCPNAAQQLSDLNQCQGGKVNGEGFEKSRIGEEAEHVVPQSQGRSPQKKYPAPIIPLMS